MTAYSMIKEGKTFKIHENSTDHIVFECKKEREAYKKLTFFNMGGAFDGWTPSFFLIKFPENHFTEVE